MERLVHSPPDPDLQSRAAGVETNPQPLQSVLSNEPTSLDDELTDKNLASLVNLLDPITSKCDRFGLQLGVKDHVIDTIERDNSRNSKVQLQKILSYRLRQHKPLTLRHIVSALEAPPVREGKLASSIMSRYCHQPPQPTVSPPTPPTAPGDSSLLSEHSPTSQSHRDTISTRGGQLGETHTHVRATESVRAQSYTGSPEVGGASGHSSHTLNTTSQSSPHYPLIEGISLQLLKQRFSDRHIRKLASSSSFSHQWYTVAYALKLKEKESENIRTNFPNSTIAQSLAMLRCWRERRGGKATYAKLVKVFRELGLSDLVRVISELLVSQDSSSESEEEEEGEKGVVVRYVSYLKGRYRSTRPPVLSLQWPPPPTCTVFNLALLQKQRLEHGPNEELVRLLQRGQVQEVADMGTEIELVKLMEADQAVRKMILMEGAPGSGKSTLAWYVCQQWEAGKLFSEFEVVVFVQLREIKIQSARNLADLLPAASPTMASEVASELAGSDRCGKGVLLVLDGWDELQPDCPAHFLLLQLIQIPHSLNLHLSCVLVTSRPVTSAQIQPHASSRVEVLGFKPEEMQEYFKACFNQDLQLYAQFQQQLSQRPVIEASCFLPLNAVIVVHTFKACGHSLPDTLHGVFEKLVLSSIQRHISDRSPTKVNITASHLSELSPELQTALATLSRLAFHGIWVNKAVFSEADLETFDLPLDLSSTLSLVQVVSSFGWCGQSKSYNFFHLQIQELLAAYHISRLEEEEQVSIFKELFGQPRFAAVFQFYSAFTKLQAEGIRNVFARMIMFQSPANLETVFLCMYEAQDPSIVMYVAKIIQPLLSKGKNTLSELSSRSPLSNISLAYFVSIYCHSLFSYIPLNVVFYNFKVDCIKPFVNEFSKHQLTSVPATSNLYGCLDITLRLSSIVPWNTFIASSEELLTCVGSFITSLVFDIYYTRAKFNSDWCSHSSDIMDLLKFTPYLEHLLFNSVQQLELSLEDVSADTSFCFDFNPAISLDVHNFNVATSSTLLHSICCSIASSNLQVVKLSECKLTCTDSNLQAFTIGNNLKIIDISECELVGFVSPLLRGLASNTSVVELKLNNRKFTFTAEDAEALQYMLNTNTTLKSLTFYDEKFVCAESLFNGLITNHSIMYPDISTHLSSLPPEIGPLLAHMLKINTTLKSLKLYHIIIGDSNLVYLAQGLALNKGLESLSVEWCNISDVITQLAVALKSNTHLLSLNISRNDSMNERFSDVLQALQTNTTLQNLSARDCNIPAVALQLLPTITAPLLAIDFTGNIIIDEGAEYIGQYVSTSPTLFQLKIAECDIEDRGLECLAKALEKTTTLEILDLTNNRFTSSSLSCLGRSLKENRSLRTLSIGDRYDTREQEFVSLEDMKQFVLSLCDNEHLTYLYFAGIYYEYLIDAVNKVNETRLRRHRKILLVCILEYHN